MSAQTGTVVAFDRVVGLGEVRAADGSVYSFHCIEVADGSRDISVGTAVTFGLLPKLGRWEAAAVAPVAAAPAGR